MLDHYGDNRRRHRRVKTKITVTLAKSISELTSIIGYTKDLSLGGACVEVNQYLPAFSLVKVHFDHPSKNKSLEVEGRILWIKEQNEVESGFLVGIQFLNLHTQEAKELMKDLMERKRRYGV